VGEFSRLTHLPIKTLHHYHEVGVLVPVLVDPATGYRRYAPDQVPDAHLARRLREVRMPLEEMRAVLAAPDPATRDAGIVAYLDQLQRQLAETATAVAELRSLLTVVGEKGESPIGYRDQLPQLALALFADVEREQIGDWCAQVYPRLMQDLGRWAAVPVGVGGALYGPGWFEEGGGRVTAFVPVATGAPESAMGKAEKVHLTTIPGVRLAVATHHGSYASLDLTYGVLGRHVLAADIGAQGPIREYYQVSPADTADQDGLRTEVCWPVLN
jgi:DNA-binding transcriptional MerR regulator